MLIGTEGVYSFTFEHEKRDDCPVCGGESLDIEIPKDRTLDQLIDMLVERQDMYVRSLRSSCSLVKLIPLSQIKKPSLATPTKQLYLQAPPQLEEATRPNLEKNLSDLVPDGGEITVTSTSLPFSLSLRVKYT